MLLVQLNECGGTPILTIDYDGPGEGNLVPVISFALKQSEVEE
jgi:hypothetical protein